VLQSARGRVRPFYIALWCGAGLLLLGACAPNPNPSPIPLPIIQGEVSILGRVVDAGESAAPIQNAYVYVPVRPRSVAARAATDSPSASTAADGTFTLTGVPAGSPTIRVDPPSTSGYVGIDITLDLQPGSTTNIVLTLAQQTDQDRVDRISIEPTDVEVEAAGTQQFTASVLDAQGASLPLTPTWFVITQIGSITETGLFTAGQQPGTGVVVAMVGSEWATTSVTVTSAAGATSPFAGSYTGQIEYAEATEDVRVTILDDGAMDVTYSSLSVVTWQRGSVDSSGRARGAFRFTDANGDQGEATMSGQFVTDSGGTRATGTVVVYYEDGWVATGLFTASRSTT